MSESAKRVLIVEDEVVIALDKQDVVSAAGYAVIGPAHSLDAALSLASRETLDAALLDVSLNGAYSWPVAEMLSQRGVPFLIVTGFGASLEVPVPYRSVPRLGKPVVARELLTQIKGLISAQAGRDASGAAVPAP